jgi:hypothetical protein
LASARRSQGLGRLVGERPALGTPKRAATSPDRSSYRAALTNDEAFGPRKLGLEVLVGNPIAASLRRLPSRSQIRIPFSSAKGIRIVDADFQGFALPSITDNEGYVRGPCSRLAPAGRDASHHRIVIIDLRGDIVRSERSIPVSRSNPRNVVTRCVGDAARIVAEHGDHVIGASRGYRTELATICAGCAGIRPGTGRK